MSIFGVLKQWWRKLYDYFRGGDNLRNRYNTHTFKVWELVRINIGKTADPYMSQLVAASAARYRR